MFPRLLLFLVAGGSLFAQAPASQAPAQTAPTPPGITVRKPPEAAAEKNTPPAAVPAEIRIAVQAPFTFAALGDLRETATTNRADSDPERRQAIISGIAQLDPKFVLVAGDLVLRGSSLDDWQQWDAETAEWTQRKMTVLPALGNHDLCCDPKTVLENYFSRFPQLRRSRYYSARADNVMVLALDSSMPTVSGSQFDWMKDKLEHLPRPVQYVVFLIHHPPMTKSWDRAPGGGHSTRVSELALGRYLEEQQKKTPAKFVVISGHVHNYERYERGGVTYIVSCGGGATPYEVERGEDDAYKERGPTYHYLQIGVSGAQMRIGMRKLQMVNGKPVWNERDSVTIQATAPRRQERPGSQLPPD